MTLAQLKARLADPTNGGKTFVLAAGELNGLASIDIPSAVTLLVCETVEGLPTPRGRLKRSLAAESFIFEVTHSELLSTWERPLSPHSFFQLIMRAVSGHQGRNVEFVRLTNDGQRIELAYNIHPPGQDAAEACAYAFEVNRKLVASAERIADEVDRKVRDEERRLTKWYISSLPSLLERIESEPASAGKGEILEVFVARLLETIPGFAIAANVRTETEEIDITVTNRSADQFWKKERQIIPVECKNLSSRCGKNELVSFKEKLINRRGRCRLGIFVSWNGFADTIDKELLRTSSGDLVIILVDGDDLRDAVANADFSVKLMELWGAAVLQ